MLVCVQVGCFDSQLFWSYSQERVHPPGRVRWYAPSPRHLGSLLSEGGVPSCDRLWCSSCHVFVCVTRFSVESTEEISEIWFREPFRRWDVLRFRVGLTPALVLFCIRRFDKSRQAKGCSVTPMVTVFKVGTLHVEYAEQRLNCGILFVFFYLSCHTTPEQQSAERETVPAPRR